MDVTIKIDPPPEVELQPALVAWVARDVVEDVRREIGTAAGRELGTSAADYARGLQPAQFHLPPGRLPSGDRVFATIELVGWLPNAIENGFAGGDMKPALLRGRNAKVSKDGKRFNTVPFRHGTPGARNLRGMGSAEQKRGMAAEDAARLGRRIHRAASKLSATTSHADHGTSWGERLRAGHAARLAAHHKTDIYAGMARVRHTYEGATQTKYMTFRRVSEDSDPRAFVHPGIRARRFFARADRWAAESAARHMQLAKRRAMGR